MLRLLLVPGAIMHAAFLLPAQIWNEVGDAGDNPGPSAQQVMGAGNLTQINGALGADDVDTYLIQIFDTTTFQASTVGGAAFNTQLFLFDETGKGVTHNDDAPGGGTGSRITGQFVLTPGRYYLAVSQFDRDPVANFQMWLDQPANVERRADGNGRFGSFDYWEGGIGLAPGAYSISLTGAAFAPNQVLLPRTHHLSEGAIHTSGSTNWFSPTAAGHFQVLYDGNHLTAAGINGPRQLTRLQMRAEGGEQNVGGQVYQNVAVRVGSTSLTPSTLSSTFANNFNPATTLASATAFIALKTIKRAIGLCPNSDVVDIDLNALGIPWMHDPTGMRPNFLLDISWTSAGPGPSGANTVAIEDTTGTILEIGGRGVYSPIAGAASGTFANPPVVKLDFLGSGGDDVLIPARVESIGAGCGGLPSSIYQLFPHTEPFDLAADPVSRGIRFVPDMYPSPTRYLVSLGTPPPDLSQVNATPNLTIENSSVMHNMPGPFSYPGGSTSTIWAEDNGLIRLSSLPVVSTWNPTLDKWLGTSGEGPAFAPFWHDFSCGRNTLTHPNSGVHVKSDASGVTWITWLNVGNFNTVSSPGGQSVNTMQCRMDRGTGEVEFRYGNMSQLSGHTLGGAVNGITGFTRGRIGGVPSADGGSVDLSRELPRPTYPEGASNNLKQLARNGITATPPHMPGRMIDWAQIYFDVFDPPPGTTFGLQLLDLTAMQPGLPVPGLTPPGCQLGVGPSAIVHETFVLPGSSVTGTVPFTVPPGFDGVDIYAQFAAVTFGASAVQLHFSNTLKHTLGKQ